MDEALLHSARLAGLAAVARDWPARDVRAVLPVHGTSPVDPDATAATLAATRHRLRLTVDAAPGYRTAKINRALDGAPIDWLLVVDDDAVLPPDFLDLFLTAAELAGLVIAQPAHRRTSHAAYQVTQRQPRSVVRRTRFVEVGPVVAIAGSLLPDLLPLPENAFGWGADLLWSERALRADWRIGVVDATPFAHVRATDPANFSAAADEARAIAERHRLTATREELLCVGEIVLGW